MDHANAVSDPIERVDLGVKAVKRSKRERVVVVQLRGLLVDAAVDPEVRAKKRTGERKLNACKARQLGGCGGYCGKAPRWRDR